MNKLTTLLIVMVFTLLNSVNAQDIDLLIKNGHLIDPKNSIDGIMDVAIKDGKILEVEENIPADRAQKVVDATGLYVTPGIIDIHVHNFAGTEPDAMYSNGWNSVAPDGYTFRAGVTTVVDQGCAGWRNFRIFKENVIDKSKTRVLAFVNIVGSGMKGGGIEQNLADMDPKLAAMAVARYKENIVGVKVAHYIGPQWTPVENAVKAGDLAGVPVMVDFGSSEPVLSLETLLMEKLRPGDILTHCYGATRGRGHVVDDNGTLNSFALSAQQRGIIFDVGHGGGSFTFAQGIPAIEQGLKPNSISTDLHIGSMNGGMKDQLNVMSKFLNMGLNLGEVIQRSTWNPAQVIKRTDLGHLSAGAEADLAVLGLLEGEFGYIDVDGFRMDGTQKLECELTVKGGQVMWDLNGISRPLWTEAK
jgi:dihydroorotase